jgi:predicted porin
VNYSRLIPLGLLGLAASVAMPAHAQSSVTLFGVVDQGLTYTSNAGGKNQWSMAGGVLQGSRWGLRGSEDLGGGTKAIFLLESGFDASNGRFTQGGLLFGRRVYMGLSNDKLGTVTLGRQYDEVVDYPGVFADRAFGGGYVASHPGDIDNFNNGYRTNNSIKYESPNYRGFHFGGMYGLGGVAGDFTRNQTWSVGAGYETGPFAIATAYMNVRNPNVSFFGNSTTGTPSAAAANISSPVYSGFASAHTYQVIAAGGAYKFGNATLGATYSNIQFSNLGDTANSGVNPSGYTGSVHFNNAEVNVQYRFTPSFSMTAAYDYMKGSSVTSATGENGGATYHQGVLSADYLLSKRTDVYVMGVYQHASGTDSRNRPAVAAINGLTASTGDSQTTVHVGLRHKF